MSSYTFSHEFYERWTCAPELIRTAITQELKDIITLLQADTSFESFTFRTHDLEAHVDELYANHEAEQAIAQAIADKQAQADKQAAVEKQRIEEEQKIKAAEEAKRKEAAKVKEEAKLRDQAEPTQQTQPKTADASVIASNATTIEKDATISNALNNAKNDASTNLSTDIATEQKNISKPVNVADNNATDATNNAAGDDNSKADTHAKDDSSIKAINDKASAAISLSLKDAQLNGTHAELIRELEMQIDDYLSDQMMLMSENLKSWLRAEMAQHLTEQDNANINNVTDNGLEQK